jgi:hypothetical protein
MKILKTATTILVKADYSATFVSEAKKLGGKWNGDNKSWDFDIEDEERVKALLRKIFGTDGDSAVEMVRVEIDLNSIDTISNGTFEMFGRTLLQRRSRDYAVMQHDSVIVVRGGFSHTGGSVKHPNLGQADDTIIEVKSVPLELAEKAVADYPDAIRIIGDAKIDRSALEAEKAKLLLRLAAIEKLLAPAVQSKEI